jgi:hypothetical protein
MPIRDEANDLSHPAGGQDRQEEAVHPIPFGLAREYAIDQDCQRPGLKQTHADGDTDQRNEGGDPNPVNRKVPQRAAVDGCGLGIDVAELLGIQDLPPIKGRKD